MAKEKDPNFAEPCIITGLDDKTNLLLSTEEMGDKITQAMKPLPAESILRQVRDWLKQGYIVWATDTDAPVLEWVRSDQGDDIFVTGLRWEKRYSKRKKPTNKEREEAGKRLVESL